MVENKITFLGVGGGRIVVTNQIRATGGFMIKLGEHQIHVDPGPGAIARARQYDVREASTDIVFVSHRHIDHANDVNAVIDAITLGGIHKRGILISTKAVISGVGKESPWLNSFYKRQLKACFVLRVGDNVRIGDLNFVATKTQHDEPYNIGFRLEGLGITIGYTSDTAYWPGLAKEFKGCSLLILNVLRPGRDRWKTHMCSEDAIKLLSQVRPELAIIQHFGAKMLRANPLYEAREIQRRTGVRTIAAVDGMQISLKGLAVA